MDVEKEPVILSPVERCTISINDLPDEVLEYILSLISPYKDTRECMLVCRRWLQSVRNVTRLMSLNLTKAIRNLEVTWETVTPVEMAPSITKRYSHSACYHDHSMYVFGGCTSSSTTFNDLWRLDLTKRQWVRPLTMGTYPSPKACASMVQYNHGLVLFGGWTHPSPYPLYQAWRLFKELHVYCIKSNRWTCINTTSHPPAMAGHSASVHGDVMVIFGGLMSDSVGVYNTSNDVWCFDFINQEWKKQETSNPKPIMRYGQSQIPLGKEHILIMGGCGGPNMVLSDIWLLTMQGSVWQWKEIHVGNLEWSAPHMWCHPACKIGEQVVVLSRHPGGNTMPWSSWKSSVSPGCVLGPSNGDEAVYAFPRRYSEENIHSTAPIDRDLNVNGRRGSFNSRPGRSSDNASTSGDASRSVRARLNSPSPNPKPSTSSASSNHDAMNLPPRRRSPDEDRRPASGRNESTDGPQSRHAQRAHLREKHLESLRRMEEQLKNSDRWRNGSKPPEDQEENRNPPQGPPLFFPKPYKIAMAMYVLDISKVLETFCVMWLALRPCPMPLGSPEETILYSLVAGRGELIMFGGIQKDAMTVTSQGQPLSQNNVSNSLHFISAPRGVI